MATMKQYTLNLWRVHRTVCAKLGLRVDWGTSEQRVVIVSTDVMISGLIKILTDKGIITDQEVQTVYTAIRDADFPQLPIMIPSPGESGTVPDPDLGT